MIDRGTSQLLSTDTVLACLRSAVQRMEQSEHPERVVFLKHLLLERISELEAEAKNEPPFDSEQGEMAPRSQFDATVLPVGSQPKGTEPMSKNSFEQEKEEVKRIMDAIKYHMENTEWDGRTNWGPWFLEEKSNALAFMYADEGGVLKRQLYDIPLKRVEAVYGMGNGSIQDWSFHMLGKRAWIKSDDILHLVGSLCSLYKAARCGERVTG